MNEPNESGQRSRVEPATEGGGATGRCSEAPGSAPFFAWLESSEWAGAGKDAGELARAAWSAAAEAIYERLYPLWEKCRKQRGEHFRAFEDTKATEERDGYFWEEGAERAYRDALNIATRVAREPNDKIRHDADSAAPQQKGHSNDK